VNEQFVLSNTPTALSYFLQPDFGSAGWVELTMPLLNSGKQTYPIGLNNTTTNAPGTRLNWPTELAFDAMHRIVISYTLNPDNNPATQDSLLKLWVDPVNESSPSIAVTTTKSLAVNSFGFQWLQTDAQGNNDVFVDNFDLATTFVEVVPEPSTFALLAIGTTFVLTRRGRRF
jgi:hypothetical protein